MRASDRAATTSSFEVSTQQFQAAMASFAAGVTVVTALDASNGPCALTATAFTSVSKEPPRCLVCIHKLARPHDSILRGASFAVNILRADQEELAKRFASTVEDRFAGVRWYRGAATGAPIIDCVLAWVECDIAQVLSSGDHDIIVGTIRAVHVNDGAPLVYFRGSCASLPPLPATLPPSLEGAAEEALATEPSDSEVSSSSRVPPRPWPFTDDVTVDIPQRFLRHLVNQDYDDYSSEHCEVWSAMLRRNEELVSQHEDQVHPDYIAGMRALQLPPTIPRIEELNERLQGTGWRTVCVDGYVPSSAYAGLMCQRIFPVSRQIRRKEHLEFAPAPDMVHDVLGHLAMLFLPKHREFLQHMSMVMAKAGSNQLDTDYYECSVDLANLKWAPAPAASNVARAEQRVADVHSRLLTNASNLTHLRRMYIWSVEFGLMGTLEKPLLFGAAFFSSFADFLAVCRRTTPLLQYSIDVVHCEHAFSDPLAQYFVARDFDTLESVLSEYEENLLVPAPRTSEIRGILADVRQRQGSNA